MNVTVNGKARTVAEGLTLVGLLEELGFGQVRVAVELNHEVVPRKAHGGTHLHEDDVIEIVHFVGGG